ncbi:MAG: hypothetical protein KJS97_06605 [Alphaproteobacteria bacterium]|nr:hypothetical protein [Alphaproteobacteria bacterium]
MKILASALAAAAVLAACATPAPPVADARPAYRDAAPVSCAIRESRGRGGVALVPVVWSSRPMAGSYEFSVDKISRSGSASVEQGGAVRVAPGRAETLGSVDMGARPLRYTARLVVSDRVGPVCVATAPRGA